MNLGVSAVAIAAGLVLIAATGVTGCGSPEPRMITFKARKDLSGLPPRALARARQVEAFHAAHAASSALETSAEMEIRMQGSRLRLFARGDKLSADLGRAALFIGSVSAEEGDGGKFSIAYCADQFAGSITMADGRHYSLISSPGRTLYAAEFDDQAVAPCGVGRDQIVDQQRLQSLEALGVQSAQPPALGRFDGGHLIDVVFLYTRQFALDLGFDPDSPEANNIVWALAANNCHFASEAFKSSGIDLAVRPVHVQLIDYREQPPFLDLATMTFSLLHPLYRDFRSARDKHGADIGCLLRANDPNNEVGGMAWILTWASSLAEGFGLQLITSGNFAHAGSQTLAHELGHNLGCAHDRENSAGFSGIYPYSFGYRVLVDGVLYRTVMAYPPGQQLNTFSSPDLSLQGEQLGVRIGDPLQTSNATTVQKTCFAVANFRRARE